LLKAILLLEQKAANQPQDLFIKLVWWLTPVILNIQEPQMGRIAV
jgi:hypothetical protein